MANIDAFCTLEGMTFNTFHVLALLIPSLGKFPGETLGKFVKESLCDLLKQSLDEFLGVPGGTTGVIS